MLQTIHHSSPRIPVASHSYLLKPKAHPNKSNETYFLNPPRRPQDGDAVVIRLDDVALLLRSFRSSPNRFECIGANVEPKRADDSQLKCVLGVVDNLSKEMRRA